MANGVRGDLPLLIDILRDAFDGAIHFQKSPADFAHTSTGVSSLFSILGIDEAKDGLLTDRASKRAVTSAPCSLRP